MSTTTIEDLIADGRIRTRPYHTYSEPTMLEVDFDLMCTRLCTILNEVYLFHEPLRNRYSGTASSINTAIDSDVNSMVDFALFITYNRLRAICERYSATIHGARCSPRAPVSARMEFPTWLSSLLSSIGPLRVSDGPVDKLFIYVPPLNTMNNYGRATTRSPIEGHYHRLTTNLRDAGVGMTPIDMNAPRGAYWTTCSLESRETGLISVLGTVHESHYTTDDVLYASAVLSPLQDLSPFQSVGMVVGYVDDKATLDALAAVAAPANVPAGQTADSLGCPVGMHYNVNCYGIQPAMAQSSSTAAHARGIYVIGRGTQRVYTCYLAQHITAYEVNSYLRAALT